MPSRDVPDFQVVPRPYIGAMDRTVVVGYDGSREAHEALAYASARVNGGKLFVVTAAPAVPDLLGAPNYQQFVDAAHTNAQRLLDEAAAQIPSHVDFETELLEGPPAEAIVNVADVRDADAIVIGSRGLGRVRAALGSVSHDVLHLADRPVVVIPSGKET
jgi:nucleotide-binding universal stress UspA family protein